MSDLRCPSCGSPSPRMHPATAVEGEVVALCKDPWHQCQRGSNPRQGIDWHWCITHEAEWLLSAPRCAALDG